ncbi:hypothetical protein ES695_10015 [Candidatus Atribacteria bacterium 1244-E10-H5-B2]|nr:MAG: hypothetical protein ES695_10015 [Candidatus Atribacteria bacterium 1244-E10-H5-B2]
MTKEEYKGKVWEILKGYLEMDPEDIEDLLEKIMAVPFESEFDVHGTYFPHNDKKKVLDRRAE